MNKEEILAMKAGPELDAQVAATIFGFEIQLRMCYQDPECGDWQEIESIDQKFTDRIVESHKGWVEELVKKFPCYRENMELDIWIVVPFYSTDISAVWQVVEKMMIEMPRIFTLTSGNYPKRWFLANFGEPIKAAGGDTAPEAICKAALLAIQSK